MSVAFVKEPNEDQVDVLPDRDLGPDANIVTPRGHRLILEAIETLAARRTEAQASGDKVAIATINRDLRYWRTRQATAEIAEPAPGVPDTVQFGTRVTIERDEGRRQSFIIVGIDEADPARGYLSYVSPLARSLISKEPGEVVRAGTSDAEIVAVERG